MNTLYPLQVGYVETFLEGGKNIFEFSYKNPHVLAYLYYTEGLSTVEMANLLKCEQRTIRRYMNKYNFPRYTKEFAQLVKHHGFEKACQLKKPTFYPLGWR
ncbi:DNA binding domain protein [Bacillus phage 268TH004]|uniref:DNA binding domain protein n=1 Tax=Bacillus phage 268TH004 TaxID=2801523 RepID=A0A7T7ZAL8_9CAUD|nr:DNA binding domain protein [Bacillus phage 276BB001]QFG05966.1 DNA binding domain protein [Bacillus phage 280BB001]QQO40391.1 DNA binding domain protein [Bacillus phage 268TH004]QZA70115.1 DNA binding domain protein [Bacillus phage 274BB002]